MNQENKIIQIALFLLLTLLLFSLWAGFALLVVNRYFHESLPGYTIGRLCIWEAAAAVVCALVAHFLIKKWGPIRRLPEDAASLVIPLPYIRFLLVWFLLAVATAVWQFWLFSQQF